MSQLAHGRGVLGTDHRPHEVIGATILGTSVPVWIFILWSWSALHKSGTAPDIEKGMAVPISVTPMIDMAAVKKGTRVQLPKAWQVVAPQPTPDDKTSVSTKPIDDPERDTEPGGELQDGGAPPLEDAGELADGATEGEGESDADASAGQGGGHELGQDGGTRNPDALEAQAAKGYARRIKAFLEAGLHCPKMPEGATKCNPSATASISGGTVTSVSVSPCGTPEIDGVATSVLNSKVGQQIPPPPEDYPDMAPPPVVSLTLRVCK